MSENSDLAARLETLLERRRHVSSKRMFGGVCYLYRGNMACGVAKDRLVVRVGPDHYEWSLQERHVRPMDFTGRPLKGLVYVLPEGVQTAGALKEWVERGLRFAKTLPPKP